MRIVLKIHLEVRKRAMEARVCKANLILTARWAEIRSHKYKCNICGYKIITILNVTDIGN